MVRTVRPVLCFAVAAWLAATAGPDALALVFPMSLTDRVMASDAVVLGRVWRVALRAPSDVVADINRVHREFRGNDAVVERLRVPRMKAIVDVLEVLKGKSGIRGQLELLFGAEGQPMYKKPFTVGNRLVVFLRRVGETGPYVVVNWPYGAVPCPGESQLEDGSTLDQIRGIVSSLERR